MEWEGLHGGIDGFRHGSNCRWDRDSLFGSAHPESSRQNPETWRAPAHISLESASLSARSDRNPSHPAAPRRGHFPPAACLVEKRRSSPIASTCPFGAPIDPYPGKPLPKPLRPPSWRESKVSSSPC